MRQFFKEIFLLVLFILTIGFSNEQSQIFRLIQEKIQNHALLEAESLALTLESPLDKNIFLTSIADEYLKKQNFTEVERIAYQLTGLHKEGLINRLLEELFKNSQFIEIERILQDLSKNQNGIKEHYWMRLFEEKLKMGAIAEAQRILAEIPSPFLLKEPLARALFETLLKNQQLAEAEKVAQNLENPLSREMFLKEIFQVYLQASELEKAEILLEENKAYFSYPASQDNLLKLLSQAYLQAKNFSEAERLAQKIETPFVRTKMLEEIAALKK